MSSLLLTGVGASAASFPAGMVARWTLDDTSAGYSDLVGGIVLTAGGTAPTSAAGIIGNAAVFGGAGRLETPSAAPLLNARGLAVECWIRPNSVSGGYQTIAARDLAGTSGSWAMYINGAQAEWYTNIAGSFTAAPFPAAAAAATWSHVVGVLTATEALIYVNGAAGTPIARVGTPADGGNVLYIGARGASNLSPFTGRQDEIAIYQFGGAGDPGASFWLNRYNAGAGRRP